MPFAQLMVEGCNGTDDRLLQGFSRFRVVDNFLEFQRGLEIFDFLLPQFLFQDIVLDLLFFSGQIRHGEPVGHFLEPDDGAFDQVGRHFC